MSEVLVVGGSNGSSGTGSSGRGFGPKKFPKSLSKRVFVFNQIFEYLFFLAQLLALADNTTGNTSTKLIQKKIESVLTEILTMNKMLIIQNQKLDRIMFVGGSIGLFQIVRGISRIVGTVSAAQGTKKLLERLKKFLQNDQQKHPVGNEWEGVNPFLNLMSGYSSKKEIPKPPIPFLPLLFGFWAAQNAHLMQNVPQIKSLLFREKPVPEKWYERISRQSISVVTKRPILVLLVFLLIIYHKKLFILVSDPTERGNMFDYMKFQTKNLENAYQQSIKTILDFAAHFQKRNDDFTAEEKNRTAKAEAELAQEREVTKQHLATIHKLDVNLVENKNLVNQCNNELSRTAQYLMDSLIENQRCQKVKTECINFVQNAATDPSKSLPSPAGLEEMAKSTPIEIIDPRVKVTTYEPIELDQTAPSVSPIEKSTGNNSNTKPKK